MLWLFHAGVVAAGRQLLAVTILTLAFALLHRYELAGSRLSKTSSGLISVSPVLLGSYLLTAVNSAMVRQDALDITAVRIHDTSRRMSAQDPYHAIRKLSTLLWMAVIAQAILILLPAPAMVFAASGILGSGPVKLLA